MKSIFISAKNHKIIIQCSPNPVNPIYNIFFPYSISTIYIDPELY